MKTIEQIVAKLRSIELEPVNVGSTGVAFSLPDPDLLDEIADALEAIQREAGEPEGYVLVPHKFLLQLRDDLVMRANYKAQVPISGFLWDQIEAMIAAAQDGE